MNDDLYLREFKKLSERLGISIRYVDDSPSGLCSVRGDRIMFLDRKLDKRSQVDVFVRDFATLDLTGYFIVPALRSLLGIDDGETGWQDD